MATNHKSRSEYTVGWMCALPKEQAAAIAMLDEEHPDFSDQPSSDKNTYTLGSIGSHNIVIACLPMGIYGTNSAATAANHMITTFPSIKIGLLVGIGGGIPPSVRLGDVVVSSPLGEFPGVVQWDFGKAEEGGKFKRIGALNKPPRLLLTAVSKLRARHYLGGGSQIPKYLQDMKTRWPSTDSSFTQCGSLKDPSLAPDNLHRGQNAWLTVLSVFCRIVLALIGFDMGGWPFFTTGRSEETGGRASVDAGIDGDQGKGKDVAVHYGLIASGNMVIKDSERRDSLNKSLGGDVLCVEMEAAGIMNDFPCVVIRGICDYADSRKNDEWQNYAAAVAAGCAKELLGYVLASDVDGERPAKEILGNVLDTVSKTGADVGDILAKINRKEDIAILNWLTPVDYTSQQRDFIHRRHLKSGQWFLASKVYQDWLNTNNQTLFCPGIPGAGKTILASIVVEDLITRTIEHGKTGVAYIYFSFRRKNEQTIDHVIRCLLKQLARGLSSLPKDVKYLHEREQEQGTQPSSDDIFAALQTCSAAYSRVFVILDALDECQNFHRYLSTLLFQVEGLRASTKLNLFATSRPIPDIEILFEKHIKQEIRASDEDVHNYIEGHIAHFPKFVLRDQCLQDQIKDELVQTVEGMFLLAQLYLESLADKTSETEMKNELKVLRKRSQREQGEQGGLEVLNQAYHQAMERIDSQTPGYKTVGRKVLTWIICAKRPLATLELQHALAVEPGHTGLDEKNIRDIELMVSSCAGLVIVDKESDTIGVVHYTTQEYFEQRRDQFFRREMDHIAKICTTYLSFDAFQSGFCQTDAAFEKRLEAFPLYSYAACNWGYHAKEASAEDEGSTLDFLGMDRKVSASFQVIIDLEGRRHSPVLSRVLGLHLAVWFGLANTVTALLSKGDDPNAQDAFGRSPLAWAAERGYHIIAQKLLDTKGIDPDLKGQYVDPELENIKYLSNLRSSFLSTWGGSRLDIERFLYNDRMGEGCNGTPLWYAARKGHGETVKLLLAKQANPNSQDSLYGTTPLWCAAANGHETVVSLLLDNVSIEPDRASRAGGMTPLSIAATRGHETIVRLLLGKSGVNPDSVDYYGQTPLMKAIWQGFDDIFALLFKDERIGSINLKDTQGWTPLLIASKEGHSAIVKSLLSTDGVDLNSVDSIYEYTSLQWAINEGYHKVAETLLADPRVHVENHSSRTGHSALSLAAKSGNADLVELLLDKSTVGLNVKDNQGKTPLLHAAAWGHLEVIELLLAVDNIDPNAKTDAGKTPLLLAAENRDVEAVESLLSSKRVDLGSTDVSTNATPLLKASMAGDEATAMLLLEAGAEPDCVDNVGRSPIFYMAMHEQKAVLELLIADKRVKLDSKDQYGITPLSIAACHGRELAVNLLLSKQEVDVESRDRFGCTPLWWARLNGHSSVANLLIQNTESKGISVSTADLPTERKPGPGRWSSMKCVICCRYVPFGQCYYVCEGSHEREVSLCEDCYEVGGRCFNASHESFVRRQIPPEGKVSMQEL